MMRQPSPPTHTLYCTVGISLLLCWILVLLYVCSCVAGTVVPAVRLLIGSSTSRCAGSWRHRQQRKQQHQQQQQAVVLAAVMGLVLVLLSTLGRNHSAVAHERGSGHNNPLAS
jgi:hypothetical protein